MHLHALDGAWLAHPFWRTKFVLTDAADLKALRDSGVAQCWIDTAKGVAPAAPPEPAARTEPPAPPVEPLTGGRAGSEERTEDVLSPGRGYGQ